MTPDEIKRKVGSIIRNVEDYKKNEVSNIIGNEAVNHFNESFINQGFTDKTVEPWQDVKRRDPASEWYGFSYLSNSPRPVKRDENGKKIKQKVARAKLTNFSPTATKSIILKNSSDLKNSITYTANNNGVKIYSDKEYAKIQNEGGTIKVFGKGNAVLPKRQFIGHSDKLNEKIKTRIEKDLGDIISIER